MAPGQRLCGVRCAPRHRADRDDDRLHRPAVLPPQRLRLRHRLAAPDLRRVLHLAGNDFNGLFTYTYRDIVVASICIVVLLAVILALSYTRLGRATRAVADNPALAASTGINVDRVISLVWIVGTGLAALAGVFLGFQLGVTYQIGQLVAAAALRGVCVGGLGSIWGALVGSLIIGVLIELSTLVITADLKNAGALSPAHPDPPRPSPRPARPPGTDRLRRKDTAWTSLHPFHDAFAPIAISFVLAAMGLNIHFGYTGLLNFGQAAFAAAARYAMAVAIASSGCPFSPCCWASRLRSCSP